MNSAAVEEQRTQAGASSRRFLLPVLAVVLGGALFVLLDGSGEPPSAPVSTEGGRETVDSEAATPDPATPAPETGGEREELDEKQQLMALARADDPVPGLARVLTDPEAAPSAHEFALELLEPRCRVDPRARQALLDYLKLGPADAGQRTTAFRQILRWGDASEIDACMPLLHDETDLDVVVAAARALETSHTPEARRTLEALHWQHSDPAVRRRLRSLGIGRR